MGPDKMSWASIQGPGPTLLRFPSSLLLCEHQGCAIGGKLIDENVSETVVPNLTLDLTEVTVLFKPQSTI